MFRRPHKPRQHSKGPPAPRQRNRKATAAAIIITIIFIAMPKQKTYEHDYEWNGNAQPQKGVNIKEKNPWPTPVFASVQQPSNNNKKTISSTPVQAPTDIDELRQAHPWQKPHWATVDKSPNKKTTAVDRDAIPKPMLKKTPGGNGSTNIITADDDAIAAMERKLAAAKQRQAELMQKGQAAAGNETNETVAGREKHVSEETKLERARRLAKEKELERWRATLKERNERDKAQRHAAGLVSHVLDDTAWQKPKEQPKPQQQQHEQEQPQEQQQRPEEVEKTVRQDQVAVVPTGSISPIVVDQQHSVPEEEPMLAVSPLSRRASLSRPAATTTADSSPRHFHHSKHDDDGDDDNGVMEDPMAADLARQIAQLEWELQQLES
jgi:hypothetical protein